MTNTTCQRNINCESEATVKVANPRLPDTAFVLVCDSHLAETMRPTRVAIPL